MNKSWEDDPDAENYEAETDDEEHDPDTEAAPDPLAAFDPDQRAQVEAVLEARTRAARQQIESQLSEVGLGLDPGGRPMIAHPQAISQWLGLDAAPPAQAAPAYAAPGQPVAAEEEPWPDPTMETDAFLKRQAREMQKLIRDEMAGMKERLDQVDRNHSETQLDLVMQRVKEAVEARSPQVAAVLTHPQFETTYREALAKVKPEERRNPQNLAWLAGAIYAQLGPGPDAETPTEDRPRNQRGQFTSEGVKDPREAARQSISRATLRQTAPSGDAGRPPKREEVTDLHRAMAERLGISPQEVAALRADSTGDAAASFRAKRLEEMKRGRR